MNYYERYCGDYGRDTAHLSLVAHGIYTVLLDFYYSTERPLPAGYTALYRICRAMTKAEQNEVQKVAEEFFPVGDDNLRHNNRADREIVKARPRIDAAKMNGMKGGRPPKPDKNPKETQQKPSGFPPDNPAETHAGVHHTPYSKVKDLLTSPDVMVPDGTPDCPQEKIVALYHELLPDCPRVLDWNEARRGQLRQRWREKAKPNGVTQGYSTVEDGLAWWRKFLAYVAESKFLTGRADPRPGREPFVADLEWLTKRSNLTHVIEGKYHRER